MPYNADTSLRLASVSNNRIANVFSTASMLVCDQQHSSVHRCGRAVAERCRTQLCFAQVLQLLVLLLCAMQLIIELPL